MMALLKYGCGFPFNRLERLEKNLGIPLPAATQWEQVEQLASACLPVYEELVKQGAQGEVIHNDDTTARILDLDGVVLENDTSDGKTSRERKGTFTTGIISVDGAHKIALFFTGRQHAGENLNDLLAKRCSELLSVPIQMCDALSRNVPKDFVTLLANCLAHGRRKFVEGVVNRLSGRGPRCFRNVERGIHQR